MANQETLTASLAIIKELSAVDLQRAASALCYELAIGGKELMACRRVVEALLVDYDPTEE